MKCKLLTALLLSIISVTTLNAAEKQSELKTNEEKMSYIVGTQMGNSLKRQGFEPDLDSFILGMKEVFNDQSPRFTEEEAKKIRQQFLADQHLKQAVKSLGDKAWKVQLKKPEMMIFDLLTRAARRDVLRSANEGTFCLHSQISSCSRVSCATSGRSFSTRDTV